MFENALYFPRSIEDYRGLIKHEWGSRVATHVTPMMGTNALTLEDYLELKASSYDMPPSQLLACLQHVLPPSKSRKPRTRAAIWKSQETIQTRDGAKSIAGIAVVNHKPERQHNFVVAAYLRTPYDRDYRGNVGVSIWGFGFILSSGDDWPSDIAFSRGSYNLRGGVERSGQATYQEAANAIGAIVTKLMCQTDEVQILAQQTENFLAK